MAENEVRQSWTRIERWIKRHIPDMLDSLSPGATDAQIAEAEKAIGLAFPEEARISFRIHDGCTPGRLADGLMRQSSLYSVAEVAEGWQGMKKLLDNGAFDGIRGNPDRRIRRDWWNPKWIPVANDSAGNLTCMDMDPTAKGVVGQIIAMSSDEPERGLVARGYGEWLKDFADNLEEGMYVADPETYGIVRPQDIPR